jgi:hypothetical protein
VLGGLAAATPRTTSPTTTTAGLVPRPHWRIVGQQIAQAGDAWRWSGRLTCWITATGVDAGRR